MKICSYCKKEKDEEEFIGAKGKETRMCLNCREQRKKYTRDWRNKNPEKTLEIDRKYRKNNPDKLKLKEFNRYHGNIEYERNRVQKWRDKNPDKVKEMAKIRYKRNPNYSKEWAEKNPKKREDWKNEYWKKPVKYTSYAGKLPLDDAATDDGEGLLQVRCKFCGKIFYPTRIQVQSRVYTINHLGGESNLYCSEECKRACPVFNKKVDPCGKATTTRDLRKPSWAAAVKDRDNNSCTLCGSTEDLKAHHVFPVATHPWLANDLSNGITLCGECHKNVHRLPWCTRISLVKNRVVSLIDE